MAWKLAEQLSHLNQLDPEAMATLLSYQVPCKPSLETDSFAIVGECPRSDSGIALSPLGLANSIADETTGYRIAALYDSNSKIRGFTVYDPVAQSILRPGAPFLKTLQRPGPRTSGGPGHVSRLV